MQTKTHTFSCKRARKLNGQLRMDSPEIRPTKNGQSRDMSNKEWTIQRYGQLRMDNPEIQATLGTSDRTKTDKTKIHTFPSRR